MTGTAIEIMAHTLLLIVAPPITVITVTPLYIAIGKLISNV